MLKKPLIAGLLLVASPAWAIPTAEQKTTHLAGILDTTAAVIRHQRTEAGWSLLTTGLAGTAAGTYMLLRNNADPVISRDSDFNTLPVTAIVVGATFTLFGGIALLISMPNESDWRSQIKLAPDADKETRALAMENFLKARAENEKKDRVHFAYLSFGLAAAGTVGYFVSDRVESNQFWLFAGAIYLASGISGLVRRGVNEKLWEDYQGWLSQDGSKTAEHSPWSQIEFGIIPRPDGAGAGLALRF